MTTAEAGSASGLLQHVVTEEVGDADSYDIELQARCGKIQADLTIGANVAGAEQLIANEGIRSTGVIPHGKGMVVSKEQAKHFEPGAPIKPYLNGRDITTLSRNLLVIDCYGLTAEEVRSHFPCLYQWLFDQVKPERDTNRDKDLREKWWLHRRNNAAMRRSLHGLHRYIATVLTAKHRFFVFVDGAVLPDQVLVTIGLDDAYNLGVLSSQIHVGWALSAGGRLGVGNDPRYNKTRCFETFPFPVATEEQAARIRSLGEQLDAHRKRQQEQHPGLTMTGMYNVLAKLRSGEPLTAKEKTINEQGLVSVLMQLHDELDAAVAQAYGWPADLPSDEILERLVALNADRAAEEAQDNIRWLRPEFQCPEEVQGELNVDATSSSRTARSASASKRDEDVASTIKKQPWPKTLPDQVRELRTALSTASGPVTAEELARTFTRARTDRVADLLETLAALGQARRMDDGRYSDG